ncbi:hypothetical protein [Agrobacterium pusense]|uniref:hypothetical protein n=1 Tax=Agrobacterium pusense TaxID=648995 RepID=UPI000DDD9E1F|nr:hypothetical protein [Agrobacterium pusense]MCJ2874372.1 hypothetical protein [Agrobacterium pusense]MCZ7929101.1 hypothetical protein [Agrobacterium pusense]WFN88728.1 hypothetical protein P9K39_20175 [Agrobacterium pusense]
MLFKADQGLRHYVELGQANIRAEIAQPSPLVAGVEKLSDFLQRDLLAGDQNVTPTAAFLLMHSYMLYECSISVALTGHASAIFPLLRTALEAACYGHMMKSDPDIERVWLNRHDNEAAMKAARRLFTSAVKDVAISIGKAEGEPSKADLIQKAYQGAIDWGAHPNPKSVYRHVEDPKDMGNHIQVELIGLHGRGTLEYERSMLACLDFGIILGIVIAHSLSYVPVETIQKLQALNDMKEALLESEFPETYAAMGSLRP